MSLNKIVSIIFFVKLIKYRIFSGDILTILRFDYRASLITLYIGFKIFDF